MVSLVIGALQRAAKPLQQLGASGRVLSVSPVRADKGEKAGLFDFPAVAGGNERLKMWWRSPVWNSELCLSPAGGGYCGP